MRLFLNLRRFTYSCFALSTVAMATASTFLNLELKYDKTRSDLAKGASSAFEFFQIIFILCVIYIIGFMLILLVLICSYSYRDWGRRINAALRFHFIALYSGCGAVAAMRAEREQYPFRCRRALERGATFWTPLKRDRHAAGSAPGGRWKRKSWRLSSSAKPRAAQRVFGSVLSYFPSCKCLMHVFLASETLTSWINSGGYSGGRRLTNTGKRAAPGTIRSKIVSYDFSRAWGSPSLSIVQSSEPKPSGARSRVPHALGHERMARRRGAERSRRREGRGSLSRATRRR